MIHYYYDSKEKLYQSVLERAFSEHIRGLQKINIHGADTEGFLQISFELLWESKLAMRTYQQSCSLKRFKTKGDTITEGIALASMYQPAH